MIKLRKVKKTFDGKNFAVDNISFEVMEGECLVLLGSSGSGKTTTLKMMNRLLDPTEGLIEIDGKNIATQDPVHLRHSIGYVFQGVGLFPHFTVEENVEIVLKLKKASKAEQKKQTQYFLDLVNLPPDDFAARYPSELSGGQRQRVGVARALATQSKILLMDEPFGALDAINRLSLQNELLAIKKKLNMTVVFVTHDILEALRLGDRIAVFNQGKIEQIGSKKEIVENPGTPFVQQLFSQTAQQLKQFMELLNG